jgi:hypothetical protein
VHVEWISGAEGEEGGESSTSSATASIAICALHVQQGPDAMLCIDGSQNYVWHGVLEAPLELQKRVVGPAYQSIMACETSGIICMGWSTRLLPTAAGHKAPHTPGHEQQ